MSHDLGGDGPSRGPSPSRLPPPGFLTKTATSSGSSSASSALGSAAQSYMSSAMRAAERTGAAVQGSNPSRLAKSQNSGGYDSARRNSGDTGRPDGKGAMQPQGSVPKEKGLRPVPNPSMLVEPPNYVKQKAEEAQSLVKRLRAEAREREERKRRIADAESRLLSAELAVLDVSRHDKERQVEEERRAGVEKRKEMARLRHLEVEARLQSLKESRPGQRKAPPPMGAAAVAVPPMFSSLSSSSSLSPAYYQSYERSAAAAGYPPQPQQPQQQARSQLPPAPAGGYPPYPPYHHHHPYPPHPAAGPAGGGGYYPPPPPPGPGYNPHPHPHPHPHYPPHPQAYPYGPPHPHPHPHHGPAGPYGYPPHPHPHAAQHEGPPQLGLSSIVRHQGEQHGISASANSSPRGNGAGGGLLPLFEAAAANVAKRGVGAGSNSPVSNNKKQPSYRIDLGGLGGNEDEDDGGDDGNGPSHSQRSAMGLGAGITVPRAGQVATTARRELELAEAAIAAADRANNDSLGLGGGDDDFTTTSSSSSGGVGAGSLGLLKSKASQSKADARNIRELQERQKQLAEAQRRLALMQSETEKILQAEEQAAAATALLKKEQTAALKSIRAAAAAGAKGKPSAAGSGTGSGAVAEAIGLAGGADSADGFAYPQVPGPWNNNGGSDGPHTHAHAYHSPPTPPPQVPAFHPHAHAHAPSPPSPHSHSPHSMAAPPHYYGPPPGPGYPQYPPYPPYPHHNPNAYPDGGSTGSGGGFTYPVIPSMPSASAAVHADPYHYPPAHHHPHHHHHGHHGHGHGAPPPFHQQPHPHPHVQHASPKGGFGSAGGPSSPFRYPQVPGADGKAFDPLQLHLSAGKGSPAGNRMRHMETTASASPSPVGNRARPTILSPGASGSRTADGDDDEGDGEGSSGAGGRTYAAGHTPLPHHHHGHAHGNANKLRIAAINSARNDATGSSSVGKMNMFQAVGVVQKAARRFLVRIRTRKELGLPITKNSKKEEKKKEAIAAGAGSPEKAQASPSKAPSAASSPVAAKSPVAATAVSSSGASSSAKTSLKAPKMTMFTALALVQQAAKRFLVKLRTRRELGLPICKPAAGQKKPKATPPKGGPAKMNMFQAVGVVQKAARRLLVRIRTRKELGLPIKKAAAKDKDKSAKKGGMNQMAAMSLMQRAAKRYLAMVRARKAMGLPLRKKAKGKDAAPQGLAKPPAKPMSMLSALSTCQRFARRAVTKMRARRAKGLPSVDPAAKAAAKDSAAAAAAERAKQAAASGASSKKKMSAFTAIAICQRFARRAVNRMRARVRLGKPAVDPVLKSAMMTAKAAKILRAATFAQILRAGKAPLPVPAAAATAPAAAAAPASTEAAALASPASPSAVTMAADSVGGGTEAPTSPGGFLNDSLAAQ